jgi:hypothetical protein
MVIKHIRQSGLVIPLHSAIIVMFEEIQLSVSFSIFVISAFVKCILIIIFMLSFFCRCEVIDSTRYLVHVIFISIIIFIVFLLFFIILARLYRNVSIANNLACMLW